MSTGGQFVTKARAEVALDLEAVHHGHGTTLVEQARELWHLWQGGAIEEYTRLEREVLASVPHLDTSLVADDFYHPMLQALADGKAHEAESLGRRLDVIAERERAWREGGYTPPTFTKDEQTSGPVTYRKSTGSNYTGYRDVTAIAKDVRADLRAAQRAGFIPPDVTISVRSSKYAGGQALDLRVEGLSEDDQFQRRSPLDPSWQRRYSAYAHQVRDRVKAIASAYSHDDTSSETDYWNVTYYCNVTLADPAPVTDGVLL
ncbi:hypothetical protein CHO01_31960 [Cellulomonas hominis]|uniref:Uncharacterized protein n=1 Tax=Cellulomonas hominis TaxID=156981 RepID=A0A511FFQ9_9CELL|nr:hypothetical protein CHO01_31960 [Cellulomonas hominis]